MKKVGTMINLNEDVFRKYIVMRININLISQISIINFIKEFENI